VRELGEAELVPLRFAGTAEADLVRGNHAIAILREHRDGCLPSGRAEVLAMHEQHRAAVGLAFRLHIHVRHEQRLLLRREFVALDGVWVVEPFEMRTVTLLLGM